MQGVRRSDELQTVYQQSDSLEYSNALDWTRPHSICSLYCKAQAKRDGSVDRAHGAALRNMRNP